MQAQQCTCSCKNVSFRVDGPPIFRMLCHCTICQKFNNSAFADVNVYRAKSVELPQQGTVKFDTYKPPPNVQRGKCAKCAKPAIETFQSILMPNLVIVPTSMIANQSELPKPRAHVFYDKRVADASDDLPKYSHFIPSQLAFFKYFLTAHRAN